MNKDCNLYFIGDDYFWVRGIYEIYKNKVFVNFNDFNVL